MGEPEQVQWRAPDPGSIPCRHRPFQRCDEYWSDQVSDLLITKPREFSVIEMAADHQPDPLGFLLVGCFRDVLKMANHFADQDDKGLGRGLQLQQPMQGRIRLASLDQDFRVERRFGWKVLEQQTLGNRGRGRQAFGRSAGKPVARKATLRGTQDELPAQVASHSQSAHLVSKHSPRAKVKELLRCTRRRERYIGLNPSAPRMRLTIKPPSRLESTRSRLALSILTLAKRGPAWTSCMPGAKASISAMVAIARESATPQARARLTRSTVAAVWLACPPVSPYTSLSSTTMVRFFGFCRPTVARLPIPISISPSPVITTTGSLGCARAIPSPIMTAPPIAPHR